MEAVRILQAIGVRPRRTIRLALWTGEEQDYFGSLGYVETALRRSEDDALQPEHAKLPAISIWTTAAAGFAVSICRATSRPADLRHWLRPFNYIGATTLTTLNTGGTDHMPFDAVGFPDFSSSRIP